MDERAPWKDEVAHLFIQRARWAMPNSSSLALELTLKPCLRTKISHRMPLHAPLLYERFVIQNEVKDLDERYIFWMNGQFGG